MRWTLLDAAVVRIESDLGDPSRTGPTDTVTTVFMASYQVTFDLEQHIALLGLVAT